MLEKTGAQIAEYSLRIKSADLEITGVGDLEGDPESPGLRVECAQELQKTPGLNVKFAQSWGNKFEMQDFLAAVP